MLSEDMIMIQFGQDFFPLSLEGARRSPAIQTYVSKGNDIGNIDMTEYDRLITTDGLRYALDFLNQGEDKDLIVPLTKLVPTLIAAGLLELKDLVETLSTAITDRMLDANRMGKDSDEILSDYVCVRSASSHRFPHVLEYPDHANATEDFVSEHPEEERAAEDVVPEYSEEENASKDVVSEYMGLDLEETAGQENLDGDPMAELEKLSMLEGAKSIYAFDRYDDSLFQEDILSQGGQDVGMA